MLLEQVYLLFIYIIFIELAIVTIVAIALFVALVVAIRKIDNKKYISAWLLEMYFIQILFLTTRHTSVVSHLSIFIRTNKL